MTTTSANRESPVQFVQVNGNVRRFMERLGSALTAAGMPRLPARAFAALLADEDGRMTSAELATALDVSAAAVSNAVRYLAQVRFLHRERTAGSRRDVYVVRQDAWHDAIINMRQTYAPIQAALESGVEAVGGEETRAGERLATSADFLDFIADEMADLAQRWEERLQARAAIR